MLARFFVVMGFSCIGIAHEGLQEGSAACGAQGYRSAQRELTPLAQAGDRQAKKLHGGMFDSGEGAGGHRQAVFSLRKTSDQGEPLA